VHYPLAPAADKVPSGHVSRRARVDVPKRDLVSSVLSTNSRCVSVSQISSPTPPLSRSGRVLPAPRSAPHRAIRVVIGDGDDVFRRALRASFASDPDISVIGEAADGEDALDLLRRTHPDVALLDEDLPSFGGGAIARIIRSELPDTRVVVLTRSNAEVVYR
jgi:CheY-like chemotaxis protein